MARRKSPLVGHRGIAARLLRKPQLESYAELLRSGEQTIPATEVGDFLNDEHVLIVHSSNVKSAQYLRETQTLVVQFKSNATYAYGDVTIHEALAFAQAQSKGHFVWEHLRDKKPYERIR